MTAARTAIGSYCYKKSISYILDKCKLLTIKDTIMFSAILFIYKIDKNNINKSILTFFHPKRSRDKCLKFRPLHIPKMKMLENYLFHHGTHIYNELPETIKNLPTDKFRCALRQYLREHEVWDSHD